MSSLRSQNCPAALIPCSSTRRRWTAAVTRGSSSWASLPEDLVDLIGWRVLAGDLRDYIRFRAVCPHWRSSTACPRGRGFVDPRFYPQRWMMLPEGHGLYPGHGKLRGFVRFFNLSTGAFVRVRLPLFRDHCVLHSVDGILLLQRDHDTAIRLLHPFTADIAEFPPLETLLKYLSRSLLQDKWYYLRRIDAASISVTAHGVVSLMGSAMAGVKLIDPPQMEGTELSLPPAKIIAKCPAASSPSSSFVNYLVECGSEILVITLCVGVYPQFSVYRLADLILGRIIPVTCIGGNALILGMRNLCVSSKAFHTIVGDTIVFYNRMEKYLAQYHLRSGTLSPTSDGCIVGNLIPSPTSIIYHIYTCCFCEQWNKGQIRFQRGIKGWRVKRKWRYGA